MDTLGPLPKTALTATCVAPILFTYSFIAAKSSMPFLSAVLLSSTLILGLICSLTLKLVEKKSYCENITITSFRPADKEISGYFVSYLIPLMGATSEFFTLATSLFFGALFFIFVWASKSFYTNPLLSIFGYKFYEISLSTGNTLLLITKKQLVNCSQIKKIAYATPYTVVESYKTQEK
uniref:hypothetical protein n=1 Tax=Halomonas sp. TaxID=1486246 RepID=UPI0026388D1C|nr:hypothetical protein [Halomonas sp.]